MKWTAVLLPFLLFWNTLGLAANAPDAIDAKIYKQLDAWRAQGKRDGWTFEVGYNPALRLTEKQRTGLVLPKDWEKTAQFVSPKADVTLPTSFDWRDKGVVGPIKDQAFPQYCGACWAFGTVAVVESIIAITTGRKENISEQQLVSCSPSYGTCGGGNFAFGFYEEKGANYRSDFPYVAADVACNENAPQHEKLTEWKYIGERGRSPEIDEMKAALVKYGPIAATVSATGAWDAYKSGVYNECNEGFINHIVAIVGYNDAGGGYWIVRNSHGTQFGEQGYIRMLYTGKTGRKCNNLGEQAVYAVYSGN